MKPSSSNAGAKLQKLGDTVARQWKANQPATPGRREALTAIMRDELQKERAAAAKTPAPDRKTKPDRGLDR